MHKLTQELMQRGKKCAQWLDAQIDDTGANIHTTDLGAYYKCTYPLRCSGNSYKASLVLKKIMEQFCTDTGDLRNSQAQKTLEPYTSRFSQTYPNGWIVLGAELLGQRDIVVRLNQGMIDNFYDEDMGTYRTCAQPKSELFDVCSAGSAVLCQMITDMPRAERTADFLIKLIDNQPDPGNYFYNVVDKDFNYQTTMDEKYPLFTAVAYGQPGQATWMLGFPSAALAKLYQATGKQKYLTYAIKYLDAFVKIGDEAFVSYGAGKAMWAASLLYRITGDTRFEQVVSRLCEFFFSIQAEDGSFPMPPVDNPDFAGYLLIFDTSPEYCRWFYEVAAELNGR
ncbi:MAG: hypothetical protein HN948_06290 [Clostridia bacterium]|jgi:hypothetical protein|nr:hypothetical protein [Clostridia bacterium]MBT7122606.1 hypothetical protein [Clostridia bacterium]